MKALHIRMILVLVLVFGCTSPGRKISATTKSDAWAVFFPPEAPIERDPFQLSHDVGLHHGPTNFDLPKVFYFSLPGPLPAVVSPVDYRRPDMSLIDTTPLPPIDLK